VAAPGNVLATLREPLPEAASRWHKPRQQPSAVRLKALLDFLLEDPTMRVLKRTDAVTELVADTGDGTSLRLSFGREHIDVRIGPFLLQPNQQPVAHTAYIDAVSALVEVLQVGSGFYVESDELIGFEPRGACPSCGVEVFEWQDTCELCEAPLFTLRPGEDEDDARAQRVVDVLLRRGMIELASPRGRRNVERNVAMYFAYGGMATGVLLGIFMDMADVAEVYCDETELSRVLVRIK